MPIVLPQLTPLFAVKYTEKYHNLEGQAALYKVDKNNYLYFCSGEFKHEPNCAQFALTEAERALPIGDLPDSAIGMVDRTQAIAVIHGLLKVSTQYPDMTYKGKTTSRDAIYLAELAKLTENKRTATESQIEAPDAKANKEYARETKAFKAGILAELEVPVVER
jgi:hypothetical protein